jgi:hypothetical protein
VSFCVKHREVVHAGDDQKNDVCGLEMQAAMRGFGARDGDHIYFSYIPTFTILLNGKIGALTFVVGSLISLRKNVFT